MDFFSKIVFGKRIFLIFAPSLAETKDRHIRKDVELAFYLLLLESRKLGILSEFLGGGKSVVLAPALFFCVLMNAIRLISVNEGVRWQKM